MRKIITLLFCLFLSVGLALADNPIQIRAIFSSGEVKPSEEPPIHATINGDMFTATFLDLTDYQPSVKKSISIVPAPEFTVPSNTIINMRAAESIVIDKGFAITQGAQMTFQTQICPE